MTDTERVARAREDVKNLMAAEVDLGGRWGWRISIPLPTAWPLEPGTSLVTYGAALRSGPSPTLFEYSDLLCRVVHDPALRLAPTFERLAMAVEAAGVTAVRPISSAELEQLASLPALDEVFLAMSGGAQAPELEHALRARCAFFGKTHGWLTSLVMPLHPSFASWLAG